MLAHGVNAARGADVDGVSWPKYCCLNKPPIVRVSTLASLSLKTAVIIRRHITADYNAIYQTHDRLYVYTFSTANQKHSRQPRGFSY